MPCNRGRQAEHSCFWGSAVCTSAHRFSEKLLADDNAMLTDAVLWGGEHSDAMLTHMGRVYPLGSIIYCFYFQPSFQCEAKKITDMSLYVEK